MSTIDLEYSFMQYFGHITVRDFPKVAETLLASANETFGVVTRGEKFIEAVSDFCEYMTERESQICDSPLDSIIEEYHLGEYADFNEFMEDNMKDWLSQWIGNRDALEENIFPFINKEALKNCLAYSEDDYLISSGHVFRKEI